MRSHSQKTMNLTNIKPRQLYLWWCITWFTFILLLIHPISYGVIRLATVLSGIIILAGAIFLFWHKKVIRISCISLTLIITLFLISPSRPADISYFRDNYIQALKTYSGTRYVWGGENQFGIDCSGLVRQGLIRVNLVQGITSLNPGLVRKGLELWWYDTSAESLRDGYRNLTIRLLSSNSINDLDYSKIIKGDLAVTTDGKHILAYLGDQTWIEADPGYKKVIEVKIPEPNNYWFTIPVYALRWKQLVIGY